MTPDRVEPCLAILMKISPGVPSSNSPTVMKPLLPDTLNSKVLAARVFGISRRTGPLTTIGCSEAFTAPSGTDSSLLSFLAIDKGWATLQLSL